MYWYINTGDTLKTTASVINGWQCQNILPFIEYTMFNLNNKQLTYTQTLCNAIHFKNRLQKYIAFQTTIRFYNIHKELQK